MDKEEKITIWRTKDEVLSRLGINQYTLMQWLIDKILPGYHVEQDWKPFYFSHVLPLKGDYYIRILDQIIFKDNDVEILAEKINKGRMLKPENRQTDLKTNNPHEKKARETAKLLLKRFPNISIADTISCNDMQQCFDGEVYADVTVRKWINDLWPEERRRPGKKPKMEK